MTPLYHNKKHQGTTTVCAVTRMEIRLYHNKKHQGTTTGGPCRTTSPYYTTTRNIRELQRQHLPGEQVPHYTTTRNIRELQLARRGCPGRSHYSPPLSAISIPTAPPRWLPSIPWAGAKSANCTANYKIYQRAFPPAGARFFILLLKLQKTKKRTEINDFSSISVLFGAEGGI